MCRSTLTTAPLMARAVFSNSLLLLVAGHELEQDTGLREVVVVVVAEVEVIGGEPHDCAGSR